MDQKQNYRETIVLLQQLSDLLLAKKEDLLDQHNQLNQQITELSEQNDEIKINHDQKKRFDNNCTAYHIVLDDLAKKTTSLLNGLSIMLEDQTEHNVMQESNEQARRFIKKVGKEVSVGHSRFCFSFEKQSQQLDYMKTRLTLYKKQVTK